MGKPATCVIYTRVSTESQSEGTSLASQFVACQARAQADGLHVVAHFEELMSGGLYLARDGIQAAIRMIESGHASALIVYKLDRTGRDVDDLRNIRQRIEAAGGRLVFADGMQFEHTPVGNLMFTQISAFAEFERATTRERTINGSRNRAKSGIQPQRTRAAYGYHCVTRIDIMHQRYPVEMEGKYVIIEEQAQVVREIYRLAADGMGIHRIAAKLTTDGIPTPGGALMWSYVTVRNILKNTIYIGQATYGRTRQVTDQSRKEQGFSIYRQTNAPADEIIYIPAPRMVSDELYHAVRQRQAESVRVQVGRRDRVAMLSGTLRCPHCGRAMSAQSRSSRTMRKLRNRGVDHSYLYDYMCAWAYRGQEQGVNCTPTIYKMVETDAKVIKLIEKAMSDPAIIEAALIKQRARVAPKSADSEIEKLRRRVRELRTREDTLVEAQLRGISSGANTEVYERKLTETAEQRQAAEARLQQLEDAARRELAANASAKAQAQSLTANADLLIQFLRAPVSQFSAAQKHDIIKRLIVSITPRGDGFAIEWRAPVE